MKTYDVQYKEIYTRNKELNIRYAIFCFMILDIIIFPTSSLYAMPYSIFFYALSLFLIIIEKRKVNKSVAVLILTLTVIMSTILSFLTRESIALMYSIINSFELVNIHIIDIKYCIRILMGIIIYIVVASNIARYGEKSNKILNRAIYITLLLAIILYIVSIFDVTMYVKIKGFLNNSSYEMQNIDRLYDAGYFTRFTFILQDSNNASYFLSMITIYVLESGKPRRLLRLLLTCALIVFPVFTLSRGGLMTAIIYYFIKLLNGNRKGGSKIVLLSIMTLLTCLINLTDIITVVGNFLSERFDAISNLIVRSSNSSHAADKRFTIFTTLIENKTPPIIGSGYSIILNNEYYRPHSDHLRFLYGYGIISYVSIVCTFLKRKYFNMKFAFFIPAFIAFTINSLIDEQRMLFTFLILLAFSNANLMIGRVE